MYGNLSIYLALLSSFLYSRVNGINFDLSFFNSQRPCLKLFKNVNMMKDILEPEILSDY